MKNILKITRLNSTMQVLLAMKESRSKRFSEKKFIIEGRAGIEGAIENNWPIKSIVLNDKNKLSTWAKHQLFNSKAESIYSITSELMKMISDREDLPEIIAISEMNHRNFTSYIPTNNEKIVLVLDQPKSPGNLGMLIRSAVAFGVKSIVISGHAADEYDHKCIRSSVGTFFSVNIYKTDGIKSFREKLQELKITYKTNVISTGNKANTSLKDISLPSGLTFLVFGNESRGVSKGYKELSNHFIKIPLHGKHTSLNVGAAASIFLYEMSRKSRVKQKENNPFKEPELISVDNHDIY